nr:hypothetical protein [Candidatus Melainabacteria bacterium]
SDEYSFAQGLNRTCSDEYSFAQGPNRTCSDEYSLAQGLEPAERDQWDNITAPKGTDETNHIYPKLLSLIYLYSLALII